MIQYSEPDEQVTLSLRSSIHIRGCDDKQPFTLRLDANNIARGTISLPPAVTSIPPERVDEIARQGNPQIRILSLTLKAPCSVWLPAALNSEPSIATTAHDFVTLSRATEVCVLFDRNWLRVGNFARLQRLVGSSVDWTGVPADDHFTKLFKQADASIFSPIEDAVYAPLHDGGPATILDEIHEAPPSYASASNKRSTRAHISSSPESPSSKRLLLEHAAAMYPGSPTERATSVSSPTRTSFAPSMPDVDTQHEAVVNAVRSMLPDLLHTMLPDMLRTVLPGVIARLLAAPGSTPSPSPSPRPHAPLDTKSSPAATPEISALIGGHVATHIQTLYDDAIDHAKEMHKAADMEFSEVLDDHRLDIGIAKNDAVAELERECHEKLVELKERAASVVEDVEAQADEVFNTVCYKLEELEQSKEPSSRILHKPSLDRGRRAISLPL